MRAKKKTVGKRSFVIGKKNVQGIMLISASNIISKLLRRKCMLNNLILQIVLKKKTI